MGGPSWLVNAERADNTDAFDRLVVGRSAEVLPSSFSGSHGLEPRSLAAARHVYLDSVNAPMCGLGPSPREVVSPLQHVAATRRQDTAEGDLEGLEGRGVRRTVHRAAAAYPAPSRSATHLRYPRERARSSVDGLACQCWLTATPAE